MSPQVSAWRRIPGVRLLVMAAALPAVTLALKAQGPPAQGAPRPLVPMTASSVLRNPDAHMGVNVSLMAAVETVLSKTVFTVDQDRAKSTGQELLVIVPALTTPPDPNAYVTVQGEVMRFSVEEIAKRARTYTIDLPADVVAKWQGRPAVLATAVVTSALVDLAKKPIPPMTPAEVAFSQFMKTINPAFLAIRGGLDAPDAVQLTDHVAALKTSFANVEAFFKARGTEDAMKWAGDALKLATTMEQGVAFAKWEDVKTSAGALQQLCSACHTQHRERMDDGSYRIKGGAGIAQTYGNMKNMKK